MNASVLLILILYSVEATIVPEYNEVASALIVVLVLLLRCVNGVLFASVTEISFNTFCPSFGVVVWYSIQYFFVPSTKVISKLV